MNSDLFLSGNSYRIDCNCSRWDVQDYSIIVETWLKKDDLNTLRNNIRPGAVSELYCLLGRPFYVDKSWTGANTLRLYPNPESTSNLKNTRKDTLIFVKNLTTSPIEGSNGWIAVKVEGYISGNSSL